MRSRRFLLPMLVCLAAFARPADETPRRVAVLDVGGKQKVSSVLTALLEARLLEHADELVLLERSKVERLLREQALGLSNQGSLAGAGAVRAGELWGVDAFCLLTREKENLRVRLVDTWYGIRLMDVTIPTPEPEELEAAAALLARKLVRQTAKVDADPERMRLVAVIRFKSLDLSQRMLDFAEPLRVSVEQQMVRWPGVIMAEREQVGPLSDERKLVEGLPERLRSSLLFLDGEFERDPEDLDLLRVYVRGRRDGETVFTRDIELRDWDIANTGTRVVETLAGVLDTLPGVEEMDPELEADMLLRQSFRDLKQKLGAAAAARALMPGVADYEFAYWELRYTLRNKLPFSVREFEELAARTEQWVRGWSTQEDLMDGWRQSRRWIGNGLELLDGMEEVPAAWRKEAERRLLALSREFRERLLEARTFPSSGNPVVVPSGITWLLRSGNRNPEDWFRMRAEQVKNPGDAAVEGFGWGMSWPDSLSEKEKFDWSVKFYRWLASREHPLARHTAVRGLAVTHATSPEYGDPAMARNYYEAYETAFLERYLGDDAESNRPGRPMYPLSDKIFGFLRGGDRDGPVCRFYMDETENLRYRADRTLFVMRRVLDESHSLGMVNWIGGSAGENIQVLLEAGRYKECVELAMSAIEYVETCRRLYPENSFRVYTNSYERLLNRIMRDHRDELLEELPPANPAFRGEPVWKSSGIPDSVPGRTGSRGDLYERRLVLEHGMAAVIAGDGVLFLDPDTLEPVRFEAAPEGWSLRSEYAADDSGIYTVSRGGIVHFPKAGGSRRYFENHPMLGDSLRHVEVLNRRLYLVAGGRRDGQSSMRLMEFDLDRNRARRLLTTRAAIKKQVLKNISDFYLMVAEPEKDRLHVTIEHRDPDGYQPFVYDPETGIFTPSRDLRLFRWEYGRAFRRGGEVVNVGRGGYDVRDWRDGYRRLAGYPALDDHSQPRKYGFGSYRRVARVGQGLVALHKYSRDLDYFPGEYSEKRSITYDVFPLAEGPPSYILDLATHPDKGLVILTKDGLYTVPNLNHGREVAE